MPEIGCPAYLCIQKIIRLNVEYLFAKSAKKSNFVSILWLLTDVCNLKVHINRFNVNEYTTKR